MSFAIALSDDQWELVADLFDPPGRRGAPALIPRRQMVDAMLFIGRTGVQWRYLPERYGAWSAAWAQGPWPNCGREVRRAWTGPVSPRPSRRSRRRRSANQRLRGRAGMPDMPGQEVRIGTSGWNYPPSGRGPDRGVFR